MTAEPRAAVPYVCPFCGEEDLRPVPESRWHCRSCLRIFSVGFHGLATGTAEPSTPLERTALGSEPR